MRRVDRIRFEKRRRAVLTFGLAFALGALTAGILIWRTDSLVSDEAAIAFDTKVETPVASAPDRTETVPAPAATSGSASDDDVIRQLRQRNLLIPVDGISSNQLRDTFEERRGGGARKHEALDIMAARGTPVRAVEAGRVEKLFSSVPGGLTIYLFDRERTFSYYYAHLDRYADELKEGQQVSRGDVIGYVGSTGNAAEDAPHLHFAIFQLDAERKWWKGAPVNPFQVLR